MAEKKIDFGEALFILGVDSRRLTTLVSEGELRAYRENGQMVFERKDIETLKAELEDANDVRDVRIEAAFAANPDLIDEYEARDLLKVNRRKFRDMLAARTIVPRSINGTLVFSRAAIMQLKSPGADVPPSQDEIVLDDVSDDIDIELESVSTEPRFSYEAMDASGYEKKGEISAPSEAAALDLIRARNLFPTRLTPLHAAAIPSSAGKNARMTSPSGVWTWNRASLNVRLAGAGCLALGALFLFAATETDASAQPLLPTWLAKTLMGGASFLSGLFLLRLPVK